MHLKHTTLNHDSNSLHEALGITKTQQERCRERVFFATFANGCQVRELYENPEEHPKEFTTKTGDLARTLQLIDDPIEYEYTLFMFMKFQSLAQGALGKWAAMHDNQMDASDKAKLEIAMLMEDLVLKHIVEHGVPKDNDDDEEVSKKMEAEYVVTPGSLMKRIDLVKKSHYSWETYYNMVKAKGFYYLGEKPGSDFDVDDMLRNLFN